MRRTGVWVSVFRNSVIHKILSEFLQPFRYIGIIRVFPYLLVILILFFFWILVGLVNNSSEISEDRSFRRVRVSPFLPFHTFTSHRCGIRIYPTQVSSCLSNHTVAWHSWRCHGWWGGRTCHGCWRGQTWGRTRWQAWNHDRNEIFGIAPYSDPVLSEMWFLTVEPHIRICVFITKLSRR